MSLHELLKSTIALEASDLFLTVGAPPSVKLFGKLQPLEGSVLTPESMQQLLEDAASPAQREEFLQNQELNIAHSDPDAGRFRVNVFRQRGEIGMVIRHIKTVIPSPESLGLPGLLKSLVMEKRGLVLFVGGTGTGKSTTLAALVDHRNQHSSGHIITVEDPIEFLHPHKKSLVSQREVGVDTESYESALKNTLRQAPDVIQIGEIRSRETMEHALAFAETGHLCLSTLHANNANQALDRIINFFPEERHKQLFLDLSLNLRGLVSQRLIPSVDGKRVAAFELLLVTPRVADLIKQGKVDEIKEPMEKSREQGMVTFDSALFDLYKQGKITEEEALKNADSRNNLRLRIQLEGSQGSNDGFEGLSLKPKE